MSSSWIPSRAVQRLWFLCLFLALGTFEWGYNVGILSSILVHPGFKALMGWDGSSNPHEKGLIIATYYLGTLFSYLFLSQPLSDRLGRRFACLSAVVICSMGIALQASANSRAPLAMLLAGRTITGVGSAVLSTSVPLYQAEVAPALQRGRFVATIHVGFVTGLAAGFWAGWGFTFWRTPTGLAHGWRVALCAQYAPALVFATGLPFVPETPRWLLARGRPAAARQALGWLREGMGTHAETEKEMREIEKALRMDEGDGVSNTFVGRTRELFGSKPMFARLWRAALLHFMAQMSGGTAMKYYLPMLFRELGLGVRIALMAGGIESLMKIPMNMTNAFLVDRIGRRWTLSAGCVLMAAGTLVNGTLPLLFPDNKNKVADWIAVIFIFIFTMGASLGFGPATWVYSSEIFPTYIRARGLSIAASAGSVGNLITAQIWPVGLAALGTKVYFVFMFINVICIPIIWLFYPETARVSLEDMDSLFRSAPPKPLHANLLAHHMNDDGEFVGNEDETDEDADYGLPAYRDEDETQLLRNVAPVPNEDVSNTERGPPK